MKRSIFLLFAIVSVAGMIAISGCEMLDGDSFRVFFDANGGEGKMNSQPFFEGKESALYANEFTREGYSFAGWNTMQDGTGTAYTDKQRITVVADMTLYAQWTSEGTSPTPAAPQPITGTLNGHDYVDLGLPSGTLWATCNVGTTIPEGYGDYFAFGEIITKESYNWDNYKYCNGSFRTLTKYCQDPSYGYNGFTDNLTTLEACDDAATANWGTGWRIPTRTEVVELWTECSKESIKRNGVFGSLFTGPNGNTIFMPSAGYYNENIILGNIRSGFYWTSSVDAEGAYRLTTGDYYNLKVDRCMGLSVRPVCAQ